LKSVKKGSASLKVWQREHLALPRNSANPRLAASLIAF
jgi:hypothetical protein